MILVKVMKFCNIRADLLERGLSVPVGDSNIETAELLEYKDDEDGFKIKNPTNGKFEPALSIDFENFTSVSRAEIVDFSSFLNLKNND